MPCKKIKWNKNLIEQLIFLYKQENNLYNVQHRHYLDKAKRHISLQKICEKLQEINPNITVENINKKIHILRTQFIKELRDFNRSKQSGDLDEDEEHEPKLWCFDQLAFLKSYCFARRPKSSISRNPRNMGSERMHESLAQKIIQGSKYEVRTPPQKCVQKSEYELRTPPQKQVQESEYERINLPQKRIQESEPEVRPIPQKHAKEENDYDWLGKQVVFEISNLKSTKLRKNTAWKIQQILREAQLEDDDIQQEYACSTSDSTSHLILLKEDDDDLNSDNEEFYLTE